MVRQTSVRARKCFTIPFQCDYLLVYAGQWGFLANYSYCVRGALVEVDSLDETKWIIIVVLYNEELLFIVQQVVLYAWTFSSLTRRLHCIECYLCRIAQRRWIQLLLSWKRHWWMATTPFSPNEDHQYMESLEIFYQKCTAPSASAVAWK